jgi:hypothetical protein
MSHLEASTFRLWRHPRWARRLNWISDGYGHDVPDAVKRRGLFLIVASTSTGRKRPKPERTAPEVAPIA